MPRRKVSDQLITPLELEIMSVLWEIGPANVQAVQSKIRIQGRELAYTTVQTMLNVLHRKGKVKRELNERAYLYSPVLSRQKAISQAVGDVLDRFFNGSADSLVLSLIKTRKLTPAKLAKIQRLVKESQEESNGND